MRKIKLLLLALPIIVLGIWFVNTQLNISNVETADAATNAIENVQISSQSFVKPTIGNQSSASFKQDMLIEWKLVMTPQEEAEQREWLKTSGNHYGITEYDSYDVETLKKLAEADDVQAMHKLARWYMQLDNFLDYGFKAAEPLLWKAAIYGSTGAIAELASIQDSKRFGVSDDAEKRDLLLESFALYKAAELRGDRWGSLTMKKPTMKINNYSFSQQEEAEINRRAQKIYNELQTQRHEIGLGDFDNSVSPAVKKLFDIVENPPRK
ncbi:hypothetical protein [Cellvibrio japonicus]|uniref:Sel1 repeat family protein n=1 Tax=Cellvibrio japonicus (strain Ueda107) TaxID=498211 RepID=B3PI27_CELJU|nr:hypothetical protein [Cellvibrio japonicus]ACE83201.1 hypothetical protein CJA_0366 [Cellvibrio japonicus Ueda107]QEI11077.1 hypothetical protein FY117_01765 [Cellvibrio japonicus]QEI14651.1 hypothetical protein FY116_01765 [Cellvibrio japonicus]QEI18231.1 hypothetical protein FY115_01765 [Cellvibrio japonicus]